MSTHQNDQSNDRHNEPPALAGSARELEVHSKDSPPALLSNINRSSRVLATPRDIICGKGIHIANHHGNLNLHLMVNEHREKYLSSVRSEKVKIIKRILDEMKFIGVRFIRKVVSDGNGGAEEWEEVDEVTAYKKVSHALRLRTKNESNRDETGTTTTTAVDNKVQHSQADDSSTCASNKPRSRCATLPVPSTLPRKSSVPSATIITSSHHHHRPRKVLAKPTDIICGRGFHIVNHRGNHNLHNMVNIYREEYLKGQRPHKAKIIQHILGEIKSSGARFIRRVVSDGNGAEEWEIVDDVTAYKKVSHALRLRTKNESNRDENDTTVAVNMVHSQRDNSSTLNQLNSRCAGFPAASSVPSASINRASAYHSRSHPPPGDSNTCTLNRLTPRRTTQSVVSVPSIANCDAAHHPRELPTTICREYHRSSATERNDPQAGSSYSVDVLLWAAKQPMSEPTYKDVLQQQYNHAIDLALQQYLQHPRWKQHASNECSEYSIGNTAEV